MNLDKRKRLAAAISIASNTILVIGKFVVGFLIGSVSVISEAVHSGIDLIAAVVAFVAVRESGKPPDKAHPFGHGKAESISGFFEGLLILIAVVIILKEAIHKMVVGSQVEELNLGLLIMGISAVLNFFVSRNLFAVAKKSESLALEADALHLSTDVYTSLGVFAGLLLIKITDIHILDPIFAMAVALFITHAAYDIIKRSIRDLMDERLSDNEADAIETVLAEHKELFIDYHDLRSRKAGSKREIDLHLVQRKDIPLADAHAVCDHIEDEIVKIIPGAHVTIHVEPGEPDDDRHWYDSERLLRHLGLTRQQPPTEKIP